jgi:hypothetical protein
MSDCSKRTNEARWAQKIAAISLADKTSKIQRAVANAIQQLGSQQLVRITHIWTAACIFSIALLSFNPKPLQTFELKLLFCSFLCNY